jgi:glycosyltransferase involved in cell wall biosynthesis
MAARSLSVVVPVYNEESEIGAIVPSVRAVLAARGGDWEILVVDNASSDATSARLEPLLEEGRVRLLRNPSNRGKGYSVRRGMLEARGELRLMCDADCAPSLVSLPAMEAAMADADVVAGLRNARDSVVMRYQPLRRRAASICFIWLCRQVMSEPLPDVFCGFKLFSAAAAEAVFSRARIDGWAFDAEVLALARALGYRVQGSGITWVNRPASRLSMPRVVIPVLRELIEARRRVSAVAATEGGSASRPPEPTVPALEDPARSS